MLRGKIYDLPIIVCLNSFPLGSRSLVIVYLERLGSVWMFGLVRDGWLCILVLISALFDPLLSCDCVL
nr:hypothetical protein [Tanacetum cinerariifolium]